MGPVVLMVAIVTGCGEDIPRYDGTTACEVETQRIVDVLGIDRFTVGGNGEQLPIGQDGPIFYLCEVFTNDARPVLSIRVEYSDDLELSDVSDSIDQLDDFPVVDGQGRAAVGPPDDPGSTDLHSLWTCGRVTGSMRTTVEDPDVEAARALTEDLAEAAGCYVYEPPGEAE